MVVPGSQQVKAQAEAEGLDEVFRAAGFDWRSAGCSMCLGHEPGHRGARASAWPRPRTATSRAARAAARARTWSARRWRPRRPSRATSSTSGSGSDGARARRSRARCRCSTATTSTPTRSSPSSSSSAWSAPGFGEFLFYDWAKEPGWDLPAQPDPGRRRATSAAARRASTRPWALEDYGFRAIVAPSFADIFFTNCTKIGLLPVVLAEADVKELMAAGRRADRPRGAGGLVRRAPGGVRDRPGDRAPPARGPRRHRRDAPAGGRDRRATRPSASAAGRSRRRCA